MTHPTTPTMEHAMRTDNYTHLRGRERVEDKPESERVIDVISIDLWSTAVSLANDNMEPSWFRPVKPGLYLPRSTTPWMEFGPDTVFLTSPNTQVDENNFRALSSQYPLFDARNHRTYQPGTLNSRLVHVVHGRSYDAMLIQILRTIYEVLANFATELGVVYHNLSNIDPGRWLTEAEEHPMWPRLMELRQRVATREAELNSRHRYAALCGDTEGATAIARELRQVTDPKDPLLMELSQLENEVSSVYFQTNWINEKMTQVREFIRQDLWNRYKFELRGSILVITKLEDYRITQWEAIARDINQGRLKLVEVPEGDS